MHTARATKQRSCAGPRQESAPRRRRTADNAPPRVLRSASTIASRGIPSIARRSIGTRGRPCQSRGDRQAGGGHPGAAWHACRRRGRRRFQECRGQSASADGARAWRTVRRKPGASGTAFCLLAASMPASALSVAISIRFSNSGSDTSASHPKTGGSNKRRPVKETSPKLSKFLRRSICLDFREPRFKFTRSSCALKSRSRSSNTS